MRLIDADAIPWTDLNGDNPNSDLKVLITFADKVNRMPTIEQPHWIPCKERLPDDLEEVNVTWVNHKPEPYYNFIKGKPFTASAVYYKGKWFWYTSSCADLLAEYGKNPNHEIDDAIEITAWMPLPPSYKGGEA